MKAVIYSRYSTDRPNPMRALVAAALVSGLCPALSTAADENGSYSVNAASDDKMCGTFVSAREEAQRGNHSRENRYSNWLMGYETAYNLLVPNTYDITPSLDIPSLLLWLENYCKSNPRDTFATAVIALTANLYPKRQKVAPKE